MANKPMKVICPNCGESHYETVVRSGRIFYTNDEGQKTWIPDPSREAFDRDVPTRGSMLRMQKKYVEAGWPHFPYDSWIIGESLECPNCGSPLVEGDGVVLTAGVLRDRVRAQKQATDAKEPDEAPEGAVSTAEAKAMLAKAREEDDEPEVEVVKPPPSAKSVVNKKFSHLRTLDTANAEGADGVNSQTE